MRPRLTVLTTLFIALVVSSNAEACRSAGNHFMVLFDEIPFGLDAPIIARVTVTSTLNDRRYHHVSLARVDKILKGAMQSESVRLGFYETSCGPSPLKPGATGIILGTIAQGEDGIDELIPLQDSGYALQKRKAEWGIP